MGHERFPAGEDFATALDRAGMQEPGFLSNSFAFTIPCEDQRGMFLAQEETTSPAERKINSLVPRLDGCFSRNVISVGLRG